jgi:acetyl-CoA acetyltransferase
MGIGGIPIINVENACASASTAFHVIWAMIAGGVYDVGLALGMEQHSPYDPIKVLESAIIGTDVEESLKVIERVQGDVTGSRAIFVDIYARAAKDHMAKYGTTQRQMAAVASKNHFHSTLNPYCQYRKPFTIEEVLQSREVIYPITLYMCTSYSDGAAAAILCSADYARKLGISKPVKILSSALRSGRDRKEDEEPIEKLAAYQAYEMAGLGPEDIDVAEVHDASAFAEIGLIEALGLCPEGEGGPFSEAGHTKLGGKKPVNVSGGLESKGHPIGATGLGQLAEIVWQLRGEAGERQVENARTGLTQNGGGMVYITGPLEEAAINVHILQRVEKL